MALLRLSSVLRSFLVGLALLGAGDPALAHPRPPYAVPGHEAPVALLHAGRATYLVTQHSVFQLEGRRLVSHFRSEALIQCAAARDTALWLGTAGSLLRLSTRSFRPQPLALPGVAAPNVTALFVDARGQLWAGANGAGVFRQAGAAFVQELRTPAINGGVATADSSVWIATSIGLSRQQGQEWTRYNEEGVANHEIPDNIVEKLLPDNEGNLWVLMSDAICVFEGGGRRAAAEAELPTVRFIGRPGNEVTGVAHVSGAGRLFATAMGLLLLPDAPATPLPGFAPATDKIEPQRLLRPLPALPGTGNPVLLQVDWQQRLWLVSPDAITVLKPKQLRQLMQTGAPARAGTTGVAQLGAAR
jgi:ligand-binding sensor domain-containing protein